jgi:hypothetical protein
VVLEYAALAGGRPHYIYPPHQLVRGSADQPLAFDPVDTCQAFSVVRIGPWAGVMATRLSLPVRLTWERVRPGGSRIGSQCP